MQQFIRISSKEKGLLGEIQNRFLKDFERECNVNFHANIFNSCKIKNYKKLAIEVVDDIYNNK